jgi:hypothetical protein
MERGPACSKRAIFSSSLKNNVSGTEGGEEMKTNCMGVRIITLLAVFPLLLFSFVGYSAVISVPGDYSTIQAAINAATDGDEIIVSAGTYMENVNFGGKNIVLRSIDPTNASVVTSTVIDGNNAGSVVTFSGSELTTCVLSGFTITNGYAPDGGGIYGNGCLATIQHNNITTNTAYGVGPGGKGGGIAYCDGTIQSNIISGNSPGGLQWCGGTIQRNSISKNSGSGLSGCVGAVQNNIISGNSGAGLAGCGGTIQNNIISGNSGSYGGGLAQCGGSVLNNTICGNSATYRGSGLDYCEGVIINCIIWGNTDPAGEQLVGCPTPMYSCIQDWAGGGVGNISADPKLVDPAIGNYHLRPDSPCIDSGNTFYLLGEHITDMDGQCRLVGSSVDMGCDEYGSSLDTDGDLLADSDESTHGGNPNMADTDGDGLQDGIEVLRGTSVFLSDTPTSISIPGYYASIQQGLFMAFPSEAVIISPGTYYENVNLLGKNLLLKSTNPLDDDIVSSTTIDGSGSYPVIFFTGTENQGCTIKGLTIRNGAAARGGGICGNGTFAKIENNKIMSNSGSGLAYCHGLIQYNTISGNSAGAGGGLYWCEGTIQHNSISNNSASSGGGLAYCDGAVNHNTISTNTATGTSTYSGGGGLHYCRGTIQNNTIVGNSANMYGGGLYWCDATIQNNTISGNLAIGAQSSGGGLSYCGYFSDKAIIQNNIVSNNQAAKDGGGLYLCFGTIQHNTIHGNSASDRGGGLAYCNGFVVNCIIWANSAGTYSQIYDSSTPAYSCIQDWTGGRANIAADPKFVGPAGGNYHLQGDSPCIDAGNTYYLVGEHITDIDGECRLAGSSVDMGCDEYGASLDTDGDLLADVAEISQGTDSNNPDTDGDGLRDGAEILRGTSPTVSNAPSGISIPADYLTIQQGLFLAFPGEEITVSPGTYTENLHLLAKNLIVQGTNSLNEDIVSSTTVDGGGFYSVIFFSGYENETCSLKGLTIRNGAGRYGGAICGNRTLATIENNKILNSSSRYFGGGLYRCYGTIRNNIISDNTAYLYGGGLYYCLGAIQGNTISHNSVEGYNAYGGGLAYCQGTIQNNTISDNSADGTYGYGGGLANCDGPLQSNTISGNSAKYQGGALYQCNGTIEENIISGNSAQGGPAHGGGLFWCQGAIQNNMIYGNWANGYGGGLCYCNGFIQNNTIWQNSAASYGGGLDDCSGTVRNCIVWQNTAPSGSQLYFCIPSYSCIQDWTGGGTGNISSDPQLANPANGDFHLEPTSPCIDAGCYVPDLTEDFEGDSRPYDAVTWETRGDGSDFDIGADEFIGLVTGIKDWDLY